MDQLGDLEKTNRGFEIIKFGDLSKHKCSLQQSSLAVFLEPGSSVVWLGVDDSRMQLDLEQVDALILHLKAWRESGSFEIKQK